MCDPIEIAICPEYWSDGENKLTKVLIAKGKDMIAFHAKDENSALTLMVEISELISLYTVDTVSV